MRKSGCKAHKHLPSVQAPKGLSCCFVSRIREHFTAAWLLLSRAKTWKHCLWKKMHPRVHNTRSLASGLKTKKRKRTLWMYLWFYLQYVHILYPSLKHLPCLVPVQFYHRCNGDSLRGWGGRPGGRKPVQTHWARKKGVSVVKVHLYVLHTKCFLQRLIRHSRCCV